MARTKDPTTPFTLLREYESLISEIDRLIKENPAEGENIANRIKQDADEMFSRDDHVSGYRMAFLYQAAARALDILAGSRRNWREQSKFYEQAGLWYHFAAHSFRKQEEYRWAGEAYASSGNCFRQASVLQRRNNQNCAENYKYAIRSFGRAKGVFGEVGDFDLSSKACLAEQQLTQKLYFKTNLLKGMAFAIWGLFTGYGESFGRWSLSYLLGVFVFAVINRLAGLTPPQALLVSFERSLLIANPMGKESSLVIQLAYAYFNLGLGLALIIKRMSSRS
jgi:hypothetical protein